MQTSFDDWNRISNNWSLLVDLFNEAVPQPGNCRTTPDDVARKFVEVFDIATVKETLAVVCEAKRHDGRIYKENRDYLKSSLPASIVSDLAEDEMAIIKARIGRLDDIHPTHINQTITTLRKLETVQRSIQ